MYSCMSTGQAQRCFSPPCKILAFRIMIETLIVMHVICREMQNLASIHSEIPVQILKHSHKQTARIQFSVRHLKHIAFYSSHRLDLGPRAPTRSALKREVLQLKV